MEVAVSKKASHEDVTRRSSGTGSDQKSATVCNPCPPGICKYRAQRCTLRREQRACRVPIQAQHFGSAVDIARYAEVQKVCKECGSHQDQLPLRAVVGATPCGPQPLSECWKRICLHI